MTFSHKELSQNSRFKAEYGSLAALALPVLACRVFLVFFFTLASANFGQLSPPPPP